MMCSSACPTTCARIISTYPCSRFSGNCHAGCAETYYGDKCDMKCGQCIDDTCFQVNATCIHGCRPGWTGDTCTGKKNYMRYFDLLLARNMFIGMVKVNK